MLFIQHIHEARGYPEQVEVAKRMLEWLKGSQLITKQGEKRVQDAYSIRCIPQIHGASWQVLAYVKEKLEIEMNAATDNPLNFRGWRSNCFRREFPRSTDCICHGFLKSSNG